MIGRSDGGLADANYDDSQANITNVESPARDVQSFSLPLEQYSSSPDDMIKQPTMPEHTVTPSPSEGLHASERASSSEYLSKPDTMPSVAPAAAPPSPQQLRVSENKKEANECIVNRPCTTSSRSAAGSRKGSSGGASRNTSGSSSSSSGGSSGTLQQVRAATQRLRLPLSGCLVILTAAVVLFLTLSNGSFADRGRDAGR
eukprot:scpid52784/ scgid34314/ 